MFSSEGCLEDEDGVYWDLIEWLGILGIVLSLFTKKYGKLIMKKKGT